jgi:hypothetical protein
VVEGLGCNEEGRCGEKMGRTLSPAAVSLCPVERRKEGLEQAEAT